MEWTDESITRLRSFWQEGLSTAEIGRRMQITKNAVVGKAHRLTLPPRPSPIRKGAELAGTSLQPRRAASAGTLPGGLSTLRSPVAAAPPSSDTSLPRLMPLPATTIPVLDQPESNVQPLRPSPPAPRMAAPAEAPAPVLHAAPAPRRRGLTCCWPLGEPGTKQFHFCGADPVAGKPYCGAHAALAYVKIRDRRDSVA